MKLSQLFEAEKKIRLSAMIAEMKKNPRAFLDRYIMSVGVNMAGSLEDEPEGRLVRYLHDYDGEPPLNLHSLHANPETLKRTGTRDQEEDPLVSYRDLILRRTKEKLKFVSDRPDADVEVKVEGQLFCGKKLLLIVQLVISHDNEMWFNGAIEDIDVIPVA